MEDELEHSFRLPDIGYAFPITDIPWHELTPSRACRRNSTESASKVGPFEGQTGAQMERFAGGPIKMKIC
jgi:hypothetical protein